MEFGNFKKNILFTSKKNPEKMEEAIIKFHTKEEFKISKKKFV